jgi:hypothetical protein
MNGLSSDRVTTARVTPTLKSARRFARTRSGPRAFGLHLAEMLIAMLVGMVALGGAIEGTLALAGGSLADASASLAAVVIAVNMTVPMIWWMHYRGHPARHNVEMAASMVVPTAVVIALDWLGAIPSNSVIMAQHVVMVPAMVGVMLWRYDHYSH